MARGGLGRKHSPVQQCEGGAVSPTMVGPEGENFEVFEVPRWQEKAFSEVIFGITQAI